MEEAYKVEIPCYFLCPISMELMRDPVTISTGISYDRENIKQWIMSCKKAFCPVTKQDLLNTDMTPNHTLQRLIKAWCAVNACDKIPIPKAPVNKSRNLNLLDDAKNSPSSQITCLSTDKGGFFESLIQVLGNGDNQSRANAMMHLKSALCEADPENLIGLRPEMFVQIVRILCDRVSVQATKAALKVLVEMSHRGRNRLKVVENGAVSALIELLLETDDRKECELILTVLDKLCGCAEGRAELLRHGAGLAIVSKKILRVSNVASERAVRILCSISKHSANSSVLKEMLQVGVASKLCLVVQVECSQKAKERAKEILRLNSWIWKDSSCIPPHLLSSYSYS